MAKGMDGKGFRSDPPPQFRQLIPPNLFCGYVNPVYRCQLQMHFPEYDQCGNVC
jgi:hypothetical protein